MIEATSKLDKKRVTKTSSIDSPNFRLARAIVQPVVNSTKGYSNAIGAWHDAHFPRRASQERIGIFWYHGKRIWQVGEEDR